MMWSSSIRCRHAVAIGFSSSIQNQKKNKNDRQRQKRLTWKSVLLHWPASVLLASPPTRSHNKNFQLPNSPAAFPHTMRHITLHTSIVRTRAGTRHYLSFAVSQHFGAYAGECVRVCVRAFAYVSHRMATIMNVNYKAFVTLEAHHLHPKFFVRTKNCIGRKSKHQSAPVGSMAFLPVGCWGESGLTLLSGPLRQKPIEFRLRLPNVYGQFNKFHWNTMKHRR